MATGRAADLLSRWARVLMANHVHLIVVLSDPDGVRRTMAQLHRRYAGPVDTGLAQADFPIFVGPKCFQ